MSETSEFITIIRPKFMRFCKDACRAATLNHLLFRIAYKCKDQPKEKIQNGDIMWYATNEQITTEMSNAWGVCKVRKEVNVLVEMGLTGRRSNPAWGMDRTKHFFFGKEQCQKFIQLCEESNICIVHLDLPPEVVHLIYSSNANDKSIKCSCPEPVANDKSIGCKSLNHQMQVIDSSDAFDKSIEALTKNTTKINYKDNTEKEDTSDAVAFAPHHDTPASFSPQDTISIQQANGYRISQDEIPSPSHDAGIMDDPHTGQLVDRVTASDMPASLDVVAVSTPSPSQASNDRGKNLPRQDSHPTAPTSTSKKSKQPPIAKETMSSDTRSRVRKPTPDEIAPDIQAVITAYQATFKTSVPVTSKLIAAATLLAPQHPTTEQIDAVKKFIYKTNPWYRGKGIHLQDVANYWERWQGEQEQQVDLQKERNGASKDTAVRAGSTIMTPDPEKEAKLRAAEAALARLKEQEKAAQQYPGMRVAG